MGRPSKLTEKQWEIIGKRLRSGEKNADLAKEFKVGLTTIRDRFSVLNTEIKAVANRIVETEEALRALPISAQVSAISLADELRAISANLAGAAKNGSITAFRLSAISSKQVDKINEDDPMESQEVLQSISALTKMTNDAAALGINLININRDKMIEPPSQTRRVIRIQRAEEMAFV